MTNIPGGEVGKFRHTNVCEKKYLYKNRNSSLCSFYLEASEIRFKD